MPTYSVSMLTPSENSPNVGAIMLQIAEIRDALETATDASLQKGNVPRAGIIGTLPLKYIRLFVNTVFEDIV